MKRILITGMSAVGKSTVVDELVHRGHRAVDLDTPHWSHFGVADGGVGSEPELDWVWREDRVGALLAEGGVDALFVAGCAPNQGTFYPRLDIVVLLTASEAVTRERLATRTNNNFGKTPAEVAKVLRDKRAYEGRLRAGADVVIDTDIPLDDVVGQVCSVAGVRA